MDFVVSSGMFQGDFQDPQRSTAAVLEAAAAALDAEGQGEGEGEVGRCRRGLGWSLESS